MTGEKGGFDRTLCCWISTSVFASQDLNPVLIDTVLSVFFGSWKKCYLQKYKIKNS